MKKLLLSTVIVAFAATVYAGGEACASAEKSCCGAKAAQETKAGKCTAGAKVASKDKTPKQPLQSPKAMTLASK
jgi:hypothetical protein